MLGENRSREEPGRQGNIITAIYKNKNVNQLVAMPLEEDGKDNREDKDNKRIMTLVKYVRLGVLLLMAAALCIAGWTAVRVIWLSKIHMTWLLGHDVNECYLRLPSSHYLLRLVDDEGSGEALPEYDIVVTEMGTSQDGDIELSPHGKKHAFTFVAHSSQRLRVSVSWKDKGKPSGAVYLKLGAIW